MSQFNNPSYSISALLFQRRR